MSTISERFSILQSHLEKNCKSKISKISGYVGFIMRKLLFSVLSVGPIPAHVAIIMDGNRRFAKRRSLLQDSIDPASGHRLGFRSLISTIQYSFEMGVKCVTVYAFSIDNFKRSPQEVQMLMDLMREKIEEMSAEDGVFKALDVKINFWGNLELMTEPTRLSAKRAMDTTVHNKGPELSVCVAYTSTNEITHAIEASVRDLKGKDQVQVSDLERNLYSAGCVEPDIIIRTSGETRLSNFLLWQSDFTHLQNPKPLWPEFSLRHLVWAVLEYQRVYAYLKNKKEGIEKNK
ncbi:Alkyl transferase [Rhynchospora pubera]|uniref:Alkyl transferase n=1 Tax=Rhynchospora pubera TaxID=906938 RepID=A0AAV8ARZ0_9POAL|nr:Alkyl transferase [Rhynchospora pubera]KAJ4745689.1 Alkyl transferase [Rhynchospora pubera]